jgi:hypothetical protein
MPIMRAASPPPTGGGGQRGGISPLDLLMPAPHPPVVGTQDGPDVQLASGVRVRRTRIGSQRVPDQALWDVIRAIQQLPAADQQLVARAGVPIILVPAKRLEYVHGTSTAVLGATSIHQDSGRWVPTAVRVATAAPEAARGGANSISEVTQHEIGHVVAVIRSQDRSEETAIRYAERW